MIETHHNMDAEDLKHELLGHAIVDINTYRNRITLDDGRVLLFDDADESDSGFSASLKAGKLTDNGITDVTVGPGTDDAPESWTLHVLAVDENVVDVHIGGSSGDGYYCKSINLVVYPK